MCHHFLVISTLYNRTIKGWFHDNDVSTSKLKLQKNEIIKNRLRFGIKTKKESSSSGLVENGRGPQHRN
jgi:hypothetical protein